MDNSSKARAEAPVRFEFVALVALLISMVALSTDIMLPALPMIGEALGVTDPNGAQMVVFVFFVGLCFGQLLSGPMSDSYGRKPVVYLGLAIFTVGCLLSIFCTSFAMMLIGRLLQGLGAAAPRIVMIAIVRDDYSGRAMARIMSFVMAVFIIVPAVAPALGQLVMLFAGWRMIFLSLLVVALISLVWFVFRQDETLAVDNRLPFSLDQLSLGFKETFGNRVALGYTLAAGCIFGAFVGYLSSAQQIFQTTFGKGESFPLYFAIVALAIGAASILNSQLVMKYGMRRLSHTALIVSTLASFGFLPIALGWFGESGLIHFMGWALINFFCMGILFGNFNALAMEPLGHIAGIAAALIGSVATFISLPSGILVAQLFDGTVVPLVAGFAILGLASFCVVYVTEKGEIGKASM